MEGLEIRYGWDGINIYNAHDIVIRNCNIHENWNQGILGNGNRVLIDSNIIASNGTNPEAGHNLVHGIYATAALLPSGITLFTQIPPMTFRWRPMITIKTLWRGQNMPMRRTG